MASDRPVGGLLSDFNVDNLAALLRHDPDLPRLEISTAPYAQFERVLLDPQHEFWQKQLDFAAVWTRPEVAVPSFRACIELRDFSRDEILAEVDRYVEALAARLDRVPVLLAPTWTRSPRQRGLGLFDLQEGAGPGSTLLRMNLRLVEACVGVDGLYPLDAGRWLTLGGQTPTDDKLWYLAKTPFGQSVFAAAARDIKAALRALRGGTRKLVVLDLDQTLWGGIVGDDGWENLRLGGHDPVGEGFAAFQAELGTLARAGVLLAIVSKNDEQMALEALRSHPEMVLREQDFAGWRINWRDKAANIVDVVEELNLGLDSVVFIDDSPQERSRVRDALPEVLVPEWPAESLLYRSALQALDCFDRAALSAEDRERTRMYRSERQRQQTRRELPSLEEWIAGLEQRVTVEPLGEANLPRAAQLFNKTNQMNLSTRRLSPAELADFFAPPHRAIRAIRVVDRFGDHGLTGLVGIEVADGRARLVDYVLSCRVMGRRVEEALLWVAVQLAAGLGAGEITAEYRPTPRNRPCLDFFRGCGWVAGEDGATFRWSGDRPYAPPAGISVAGDV